MLKVNNDKDFVNALKNAKKGETIIFNEINENKEDLSLEIYKVRYYKLTSHERLIIDKLYISKFNLKKNE